MNGKDLEKALLWEAPHIGEKAPEQIPEAQNFCEGYKTFLNEGKTERECVKKAVSLLTNAGYKEFDPKASYKLGDKIYWVNRKKAIIASTIGTKDLNEGLRMNGAHIDSPRRFYFIFEIQDDPLGCLCPDAGRLRDCLRVTGDYSQTQHIRFQRGEDSQGTLRTDPVHPDQLAEHLKILP